MIVIPAGAAAILAMAGATTGVGLMLFGGASDF